MRRRVVSSSDAALALSIAALTLVVCAALALPAIARRAPNTRYTPPLALFPATHLSGQTTGTLPREKLTLRSALAVDLTRDMAILPLHEGDYHGMPVWYVITDVSDAGLARTQGVNFAPRLANVGVGCPACVQEVSEPGGGVLGRGRVEFTGAPG